MIQPSKKGAEKTRHFITYLYLLLLSLDMDKTVNPDSIGQLTSSTDIIKASSQLPNFTVYPVILLREPNNVTMIMTMQYKKLLKVAEGKSKK